METKIEDLETGIRNLIFQCDKSKDKLYEDIIRYIKQKIIIDLEKSGELGIIQMNTNGIRKLADSMDMIYGNKIIHMPVYQNGLELYFQLSKGSGEIKLVSINEITGEKRK